MDLPPGYTARPHTMDEAGAVTGLVAAAEREDVGEPSIEEADIVAMWQSPTFDLAGESLAIWHGADLAASGDRHGNRAEAAVHPDHRGLGLGTALAGWLEDNARSVGETTVGQTVPAESSAERFFRQRGYRDGWTSWVLRLPEGAVVEPQPLPPGYTLTDVGPGDARTAYRLVEDAFNEWPDRSPRTFESWASRVTLRPGFEPWQLRFARDAVGEAVGVCFTILAEGDAGRTGYVDQLAVRSDQRGLALGRALLVDAFARARDRGAVISELATDSRTGALGLYEHVGMTITQTWRHLVTDL